MFLLWSVNPVIELSLPSVCSPTLELLHFPVLRHRFSSFKCCWLAALLCSKALTSCLVFVVVVAYAFCCCIIGKKMVAVIIAADAITRIASRIVVFVVVVIVVVVAWFISNIFPVQLQSPVLKVVQL